MYKPIYPHLIKHLFYIESGYNPYYKNIKIGINIINNLEDKLVSTMVLPELKLLPNNYRVLIFKNL